MNILITGASRGLGAALARCFAARNADRILLTSANENRLNELVTRLKTEYPLAEVSGMPADLTDEQDATSLVSWIGEHGDALDILINNAGYLVNRGFGDTDTATAERIFRVNYFAPAFLIRSLTGLLARSEHGACREHRQYGRVPGQCEISRALALQRFESGIGRAHRMPGCRIP